MQYHNLSVEDLAGSEIEIKAEIPEETVATFRKKAIAALGREVSVQGFRKGHVPEDVLVRHLGEHEIMHETAEMAISQAYATIVADKKLDVVGRPNVTIMKLAAGNPIGFTITSAVMPKFDLPDYATLAKTARETFADPSKATVSDEELDKAVLELRRRAAQYEQHRHEDAEEANEPHEHPDIPDTELPPLNDETVGLFGPFKTVEDFKKVLREQMQREKETQEREKLRLGIIDAVLEKTNITVPALFTDHELNKMLIEFKNTLSRMGLTLEEYLEKNAVTEEKVRDEWRPEAEKRAKIDLLLTAIAKKEELKPDEKKVELETGHLLAYHKEADPANMRTYVEAMLTNEEVFRLLEGKEKNLTEKTS
jgi:FKBP-type peptidyl-prolyl cis-trans isomerase (trigger factor)